MIATSGFISSTSAGPRRRRRPTAVEAGDREQLAQHLAAVGVVLDDHLRPRRQVQRPRAAARPGVPPARPSAAGAPRTRPLALSVAGAVTVPPCIATSERTRVSPTPSPPCARSSVRSDCTNRSKTVLEHLRGDARRRRPRGSRLRRPRGDLASRTWPPRRRVLRGVAQQVRPGSAAGARRRRRPRAARRSTSIVKRRRARLHQSSASTSAASRATLRRSITAPPELDLVLGDAARPRADRRAGAPSAAVWRSRISSKRAARRRRRRRRLRSAVARHDGAQRVAQLVREHRQELVAPAHGLLDLLLGPLLLA